MTPLTPLTTAVVGTTITCSFILLGNAITQSLMGVPALLVSFPAPTSPSHPTEARRLGRAWPTFWKIGNVFFRPISTLGIFGYGFTAWSVYNTGAQIGRGGEWRWFALSAVCHLVTVVHSAVNMQPLNERIEGLAEGKGEGKFGGKVETEKAEWYARRWVKLNWLRAVMPAVAGGVALWRSIGGERGVLMVY